MAVRDRLGGRLPGSSDVTVVGGFGLLVLVGVLAVIAGPVGVGAGLVVTALALVLPSTYVVAFGHVLLLPVLPQSAGIQVAVWGTLLVVLVGQARRLDGGARVAVIALVLAGALWLGTSWMAGLAGRAALLLGVGGLAAYFLHRYEVATVRFDPTHE